jgi:excinuclease ABC subunit C
MKTNQPDLAAKIREVPHRPGVYVYRDRLGRIIYVGKARDLRKRISQYFHPSRRTTGDRKTQALVESVWDVETHVVRSEPEAILLEGRLIKEYRPRYNVSFRDDKKFLLAKINLNDPYPRFQMTRLRKDDGARYFGPFYDSAALRSTLSLIRKKFHIRSCRPEIPGEVDFRHCLEHIIKNCSAPCVQKITRAGYLAQVKLACEFLEGQTGEMQASLEKEMQGAAQRLDFEKAARLRDQIENLKITTKPVRRYTRQLPSTVNPREDILELQTALGLPSPLGVIECFDISNISVTHKVASMVCFRGGRADRQSYRRYRIRTVPGQDDFASMAEVVHRRYGRVLKEGIRRPDLIVVDGGKGQLSSALRELEALGLGQVPIIGLAKEREEIFQPGQEQPLVLDPSSGALRLLQRIRDEAHRFANAYHQLLLKKRINESLLDDCPGISENRKKLLLQHFGSMDRLRKADAAAIRKVAGVGPKLAATLADFLAAKTRPNAGSA